VLPRLQLDLFTITSSPRKFAECLYCNVTPPPILHVLSHFIEFIRHVQLYSRAVLYNLYSHTNHIHSYIHTITHSYINTFTHQRIHNIYMISIPTWLHQSPKSCLVVSFQFGPHLSLCQANILQPLFIFLCQSNSLQLPFCYFCAKLKACKHLNTS